MLSNQIVSASGVPCIIGKTDSGVSMPLIQHLVDTGGIGALLWDHWLPASTKNTVRESFGGDDSLARACVVLLCGLHDIGKCTPSFAFDKADCYRSAKAGGFPFAGMAGQGKGEYHSVTGQVILEKYLRDCAGASIAAATGFGIVIGSHHGVTPNRDDVLRAADNTIHTGVDDVVWSAAQTEIIEATLSALAVDSAVVRAIAKHGLLPKSQVVLAGVVIMADWLASDTVNFPVIPAAEMELTGTRAETAWRNLNLPSSWEPAHWSGAQQGLDGRFSTPERTMAARPFQQVVVEMAQHHDGLMIVEAPMGEGKTEAALIAAETIAARTGAGGVFVALPTQATANQMFTRALSWLTRTIGSDENDVRSVYLAHGKSLLNDEYSSLIGSDRAVTAHRWMQGRKRGALAPFVVGTIDQILSAALQSKHLTMRHLALANKVVILDEVHAIDAYMGSYLNRALEWLGFYGVPVIALSATLPSSIRRSLIKSYDAGRQRSTAGSKASRAALLTGSTSAADPYVSLDGDIGYPVISASRNGQAPVVHSVAPDSTRDKSIRVHRLGDEPEDLTKKLDELLAGGGCVGIIRNTVKRAQETYLELKDLYGDHVILTHSRFVSPERIAREKKITTLLGADKSKRPERLIVVGTQVLEQSLDIDFDAMVIDMAPVDVMFQRMGRLHRHATTQRPAGLTEPQCFLTGVDWQAAVPSPAGDRNRFLVYPGSLMYRSLAVLLQSLDMHPYVTLPKDISPMVQAAYAEDATAPDGWEKEWEKAEEDFAQDRKDARAKAVVHQLGKTENYAQSMTGFASDGNEVPDGEAYVAASVRDIDPSYEVVLVQEGGGNLFTLSSLPRNAGRRVSTITRPGSDIEKTVVSSTVNIPAYSIKGEFKDVIRELKPKFSGWEDSPWLNDLLVVTLDGNGRATVGDSIIAYDDEVGLTTARVEGQAS